MLSLRHYGCVHAMFTPKVMSLQCLIPQRPIDRRSVIVINVVVDMIVRCMAWHGNGIHPMVDIHTIVQSLASWMYTWIMIVCLSARVYASLHYRRGHTVTRVLFCACFVLFFSFDVLIVVVWMCQFVQLINWLITWVGGQLFSVHFSSFRHV